MSLQGSPCPLHPLSLVVLFPHFSLDGLDDVIQHHELGLNRASSSVLPHFLGITVVGDNEVTWGPLGELGTDVLPADGLLVLHLTHQIGQPDSALRSLLQQDSKEGRGEKVLNIGHCGLSLVDSDSRCTQTRANAMPGCFAFHNVKSPLLGAF